MKLEHQNNDQVILFTYKPDKSEVHGFFDEDDRFVYLNVKLPRLERECVYFHELTHKKCFEAKCKCWRKTFLCEYHAYRGELRRVIETDNRRLTRAYFSVVNKAIEKMEANPTVWGSHLKALRKLMRTKAFKELARNG